MRLYLQRHGHALQNYEDPQRPLSALGRAQAEAIARVASGHQLKPGVALTSPKLRARQTAEILLQLLGAGCDLEETDGLLPNSPVAPWVSRLSDEESDTLLVGHNPFMENLSKELLNGAMVPFGTATLACIERDAEGNWLQLWCEDSPSASELGYQ